MKFLVLIFLVMLTNVYASTAKPNIVYGNDNRVEIESLKNQSVKDLAKSVAVRVEKNNLDDFYAYFSVKQTLLLDDAFGIPMCIGQKFSSQPSVADCTGFLVNEDTLITAGHCMLAFDGQETNSNPYACRDNYWVFDYMYKDSRLDLGHISHENVYSCKSVKKAHLGEIMDYAIVKLDRKVTNRPSLKLRTKGKVSLDEKLFVIGAPSGLPLKYAGDAKVTSNKDADYFATNLDTFGGNSGSPVFNEQTHEVEGILVRGRADYVENSTAQGTCITVNKCDQNGKNCSDKDRAFDLEGEHVFRIRSLSL